MIIGQYTPGRPAGLNEIENHTILEVPNKCAIFHSFIQVDNKNKKSHKHLLLSDCKVRSEDLFIPFDTSKSFSNAPNLTPGWRYTPGTKISE